MSSTFSVLKGLRSTGVLMLAALVALTLFVQPGAVAMSADPIAGASGNPESSSASANAWEPTVKVSGSPDRSIVGEWDEDSTPQGNMIAGWITSGGGIGCGFKTSSDGGKTWTAPFYAPGISAGGDPVIVPDRSAPGTVYVMCIGAKSGNDYNVIAKSTDDGKTWTNWDRGASWSPVSLDYAMMVARGGTLVQVFNQGQADTNTIYSIDDGMTWSAKLDVGSGWPNCIEEDKDDNLWIMSGNSGQQVNFYKSTDYGKSWSSAKSAGGTGGARLSCATDHVNGDLYAVTESTSAVTVFHSADGGATWMRHTVHSGSGMGDDGDGSYASMAVDTSGNLHVGYLSTEGGSTNAYYSNSTDKGGTWSTPLKINDIALSACGSTCAHYGHGLVVVGKRVCFGFVAVVSGSAQYRHTCNGEAGGGGGGAQLARIEVTPDPGTVAADATLQFTAKGIDTNGNQTPITPTWSATGGTVSAAGLFTPTGPVGTYQVQAKQGGVTGVANVSVTPGALASITVTPPTASITADQTQQFAAAGADAKGNVVPLVAQWSASGGTVSGSGLFTPDKIGSFTVTASDKGKSGTGQVTVTVGALAKLVVDPDPVTMRADETKTFTASGVDAHGNAVTVTVSWSVSGGGPAGAISASGLYTPDKVGSYMVTATSGAVKGDAAVTVTPGRLAKVTIDPMSVTLNESDAQQFTYTAADSKSNPITSLTPKWTVSGTIGVVDATGSFSATKAGSGKVVVSLTDSGVVKSAEAFVMVKEKPVPPPAPVAGGLPAQMFGIDTWLFLVMLLAIVAVVAAAAAMASRRKRQPPPAAYWQQGYAYGVPAGPGDPTYPPPQFPVSPENALPKSPPVQPQSQTAPSW